MTQEVLKLALEALEGFIPYLPLKDEAQCNRYDHAITAIKEALAQTQEPVVCCQQYDTCLQPCTPRGEHLAQRTWVGLTDEDISKISQRLGIDHDDSWTDLKQAIEAKLKDKNT